MLQIPNENQFGVALNQSLCSAAVDPGVARPCLVPPTGYGTFNEYIIAAGLRIASNSSSTLANVTDNTSPDSATALPLSVITLHDFQDLAVIVPARFDSSLVWTAPSYAIRAQCSNLTPRCTDLTVQDSPMNCSSIGWPELPFESYMATAGLTSNRTPGRVLARLKDKLVGHNYGQADSINLPSNPQNVMVQLNWPVNVNDASGVKVPNDFVKIRSTGSANAFASCDLSFFNVTVRHAGGQYSVVGEPERAVDIFVGSMWGALIAQMINLQLHSNLQASLNSSLELDSILIGIIENRLVPFRTQMWEA